MTNNVEEVINQGVKPQIQSITTPTWSKISTVSEDYEDLVWLLPTDQVTTFITITTVNDRHEI